MCSISDQVPAQGQQVVGSPHNEGCVLLWHYSADHVLSCRARTFKSDHGKIRHN
ncbi:hypothetical protein F441_19751 [Phytophthora nicotianae CJ01A1]|uniref:Uncharacterized protein n=1 Tax=Phytophthora nicotianae CJ01A1 TaxID=1317063 RepID=W2VY82_PHYNI|nr:hypothetical protein F441_19751 [Phytophthora nicotianae CJ01A1]